MCCSPSLPHCLLVHLVIFQDLQLTPPTPTSPALDQSGLFTLQLNCEAYFSNLTSTRSSLLALVWHIVWSIQILSPLIKTKFFIIIISNILCSQWEKMKINKKCVYVCVIHVWMYTHMCACIWRLKIHMEHLSQLCCTVLLRQSLNGPRAHGLTSVIISLSLSPEWLYYKWSPMSTGFFCGC